MKKTLVLDFMSMVRIATPNDLKKIGVSPSYLYVLAREGEVIRLSRGYYAAADYEFPSLHSYAHAQRQVPKGVVCLYSALFLHGIGSQVPYEIWMAVPFNKAKPPKAEGPPIKLVQVRGEYFYNSIQVMEKEGLKIKIYSATKTIVDCFKYQNHVGLDVALEAMKDALSQGMTTPSELHELSKIAHIQKRMKPYIESVST